MSALAPTRIWISVAGKDQPEWVVERMTSGDVGADGSFEIEAGDGPVTVLRGFAVFEFNGSVYACLPREMPGKLVAIAAASEPVAPPPPPAARPSIPTPAPAARDTARAALKIKPAIGEPPSPQFAAIDKLTVDDTYQRSIEGGASQRLIVKIAENWDWRLCLPLLVSRREGRLYVIDGQHRKEAADLRGDIAHLPVVVFDFDDPKAEAELFVQGEPVASDHEPA